MHLSVCLLAVVAVTLTAAKRGAGKTSSPKTAAIPRSKSAKRPFITGPLYRLVREIKASFSSELESITLQLTRPVDAEVPARPVEELVAVLGSEYENPEFLVSALAKLSRKLGEINVYTKLKSLFSLHKLMTLSGDDAQVSIMKCMMSLRSEQDSKAGDYFFSMENVEQLVDSAVNVAELEVAEFAKEYATYVLDFVDARGDKSPLRDNVLDRTELVLSLLAQGIKVEEKGGSKGAGAVVRQCVDAVLDDRKWVLKQLSKLHDIGISDEALEEAVQKLLLEFQVKFTPRVKARIADAPIASKQSISIESVASLPSKPAKPSAEGSAPATRARAEPERGEQTSKAAAAPKKKTAKKPADSGAQGKSTASKKKPKKTEQE